MITREEFIQITGEQPEVLLETEDWEYVAEDYLRQVYCHYCMGLKKVEIGEGDAVESVPCPYCTEPPINEYNYDTE